MAGSIEWLAQQAMEAERRFSAGEGTWDIEPESWKYTRIGEFLPEAPRLAPIATRRPNDLGAHGDGHMQDFDHLQPTSQALVQSQVCKVRHPLADLNLAQLDYGLLIRGNAGDATRIHVDFPANGSGLACQRLVVHAEPNCHIEILEDASSTTSLQNLVIQLTLEQGASVEHYRTSGTHGRAWSLIEAEIGKDARYELSGLLFGTQRERVECRLHLLGEGARLNTRHLLLGKERERGDLQLGIRHGAPRTHSRHMLKTLAADRSQLTLRGRVHVESGCPGADAELNIRNLLLGGQSRVNAKPELEIYTDDVACSHGTTYSEIDAEQLFYLSSRGIPGRTARELLLKAFAQDCLFRREFATPLNSRAIERIEGMAA